MADRTRLARLAGLTRRELDCVDEQLLEAWTAEGLPEGEAVWRLRRVRRLHRQLGLDYEAVEIIVRLLDRLERLEQARGSARVTLRVVRR